MGELHSCFSHLIGPNWKRVSFGEQLCGGSDLAGTVVVAGLLLSVPAPHSSARFLPLDRSRSWKEEPAPCCCHCPQLSLATHATASHNLTGAGKE